MKTKTIQQPETINFEENRKAILEDVTMVSDALAAYGKLVGAMAAELFARAVLTGPFDKRRATASIMQATELVYTKFITDWFGGKEVLA